MSKQSLPWPCLENVWLLNFDLLLLKRHKPDLAWASAFVWGPKDTFLGKGMATNWSHSYRSKIKDQDQIGKIKSGEDQDQEQ